MLEFAGPLVSKRGFDPQYASVFDRYAASTRSLLGMFRFNFNTKFGKDKKPIKNRPATQNTQRVEISIRNATRRKRSGSGPLRLFGALLRPCALFGGLAFALFPVLPFLAFCFLVYQGRTSNLPRIFTRCRTHKNLGKPEKTPKKVRKFIA